MSEILKIALQKKGRLHDDSTSLLKSCGIKFQSSGGKLVAKSHNFPMELLYLRDDDIPECVADGVTDIGIVGENEVLEKNKIVDVADRLGFSKCRLSLAIPKGDAYDGLSYFQGKKIATSYPNILQKFLSDNNINAEVHEISGSVEIAPGIGLANAIFDIVSSGGTLISNGLKEVETVMKSEALLIANKNLSAAKTDILNQLLFRIQSVKKAKSNKYILLNAPNDKIEEITAILPGMKSPTVTPLAEQGWSSLHSVVREDDFWAVINKLKAHGAQGILVIPIEKMIL